jgi:hypothetical protein
MGRSVNRLKGVRIIRLQNLARTNRGKDPMTVFPPLLNGHWDAARISSNITAFTEIFLCLNFADQLKVEQTGQVSATRQCPVPVWFHQIRQDPGILHWEIDSFSGKVKMKQAEIWLHMKEVPIFWYFENIVKNKIFLIFEISVCKVPVNRIHLIWQSICFREKISPEFNRKQPTKCVNFVFFHLEKGGQLSPKIALHYPWWRPSWWCPFQHKKGVKSIAKWSWILRSWILSKEQREKGPNANHIFQVELRCMNGCTRPTQWRVSEKPLFFTWKKVVN